jgi:hypothetical protein
MTRKCLVLLGVFTVALLFLAGNARADTVVSSGSGTLKGTWGADLDAGVLNTPTFSNQDIWWEQVNGTVRDMVPLFGKGIINLGVVNFSTITEADLASLSYSTTPIDGNNDSTNLLVDGDVFAVWTKDGNFAKVDVLDYGYNIGLQWATYAPAAVPEPSSILLLGAGLLGLVGSLRRKLT